MKALDFCNEVYTKWDLGNKMLKDTYFEEGSCLKFNRHFNEAYKECEALYQAVAERYVSEIKRFIMAINIFSREAWFQLTDPDDGGIQPNDLSLTELARQGSIYSSSKGLSLIPKSSRDKDEKYQLKGSQFSEKFDELCSLLIRGYDTSLTIPFGEIVLNNKNYPIHVGVQKCDLSKLAETAEFRRVYHRLLFSIEIKPPLSMVLVLPESVPNEKKADADFSRLKGFTSKQELENLLRWGLMSLIGKFYKDQPYLEISPVVSPNFLERKCTTVSEET
jgi:hypothetical protein